MKELTWHLDDDDDLIAVTDTHELFVFKLPAETAAAQGAAFAWAVDCIQTMFAVASGTADSLEDGKVAAVASLRRALLTSARVRR